MLREQQAAVNMTTTRHISSAKSFQIFCRPVNYTSKHR